MLEEIIGTILQILVFVLIPGIFYLLFDRGKRTFFEYLGIKKSPLRANLLGVLASLFFTIPLLLLIYLSPEIKEIMLEPKSVTGKIHLLGLNVQTIAILLVTAIFKTSFAEEILFRGFLAKRLISWLGFNKGNALQATIFGLIHTALFATMTTNPLFLFLIFIIPGFGAYVLAYINEKEAKGSILPGWIAHALANLVSYSLIGFVI